MLIARLEADDIPATRFPVQAPSTILVGIISLIQPFSFNPLLIQLTGSMMFLAGILVVVFLKTGHVLTKKEGIVLLMFYLASLILEFIANRIF